MSHTQDQTDFDFLLNNARIGKAQGISHFVHLDQPIGIWNYIRIANDIVNQLPAGAHMLDWGCGMGQMTYLLQQRGQTVTAYDVREESANLPDTPLTQRVNVTVSQDPTQLPFDDETFDAVLSCGVLEHVDEFSRPGNEMKSLREIHRILKSRGTLLIYQLPQVNAWQEAMIRRFKLGYSHPRRYTGNEIKRMLADTGYKSIRLRRANLIPKNLTGMPEALRKAYSAASKPLIAVDGVLSQTPGLNALAGVLEVTAVKI
jgi:SAM-dependent methyltransferase